MKKSELRKLGKQAKSAYGKWKETVNYENEFGDPKLLAVLVNLFRTNKELTLNNAALSPKRDEILKARDHFLQNGTFIEGTAPKKIISVISEETVTA